jgi:large subunit ribosomal protein L16
MNLYIVEKKKKLKSFFIKKNKRNQSDFFFNKLKYGIYGFKALETKNLLTSHFMTLHKILIKTLKKKGKFFFNLYPSHSLTKKSTGLRMGGGKGKIETWYCSIHAGSIFLEIETSLSFKEFQSIFFICINKLPLKFKLINLKNDTIFLSKA